MLLTLKATPQRGTRVVRDDYVDATPTPKPPPASRQRLEQLAARLTNRHAPIPVRFTPKERYMNTQHNEQLTLGEQLDEAAGSGNTRDDDTEASYEAPVFDVGYTILDALSETNTEFGSNSLRVGWRGIGNSALYTALMGLNFWLEIADKDNVDPGKIEAAHRRASVYAGLYNYAKEECLTLRQSEYDEVMTPEAMFDFMTKGEPREFDRDAAMFEALLPSLGLEPTVEAGVRAERTQKLKADAVKQRITLIGRRDEVLNEFHSIDTDYTPDQLNAVQHLRLIEKVQQKLKDAARRALVNIGKYPDATSDVAEFTAAAAKVDRIGIAFRRRNKDDLRDQLQNAG
jgi:hypothetical protein